MATLPHHDRTTKPDGQPDGRNRDVQPDGQNRQREPDRGGRNQAGEKKSFLRNIMTMPPFIKTVFDKFPLVVYPADPAPWSANFLDFDSDHSTEDGIVVPRMFIFGQSTTDDPVMGAADVSFNPTCLRFQAYLRFQGIKYVTVPSNNHASSTGSLPFLILPGSKRRSSQGRRQRADPVVIPSGRIIGWAEHADNTGRIRRSEKQTEEEDGMFVAYRSLIEHRIRRAWIFAAFMTTNFDTFITPLYINPASASSIVRTGLRQSIRHTAQSELFNQPGSTSAVSPNTHFIRSLFTFPSAFSAAQPGSHSLLPSLSYDSALPDPDQENKQTDGEEFVSGSTVAAAGTLSVSILLDEADEAFAALSSRIAKMKELNGEQHGWLSGQAQPGLLDASLFSYLHPILAPDRSKTDGKTAYWSERCLHDLIDRHDLIKQHWRRLVKLYFPHVHARFRDQADSDADDHSFVVTH